MDPQQIAQLQQQVAALHADNERLRAEIGAIHQRAQNMAEVRATVLRGGGRLLVPLLDRQKVVRSFAKLAETTSAFAGPMDAWPARDQVLGDARTFMESCVRFAIRRRMLLVVFSIIAATVPAIQIWLVVQQNQIIANQTEFFQIQVYDIVSRSMTEGDRNAKLMTGALLSRADPAFLQGVVEEAFHPDLAAVYRPEGVRAGSRRLEDAAFRGHLVRAVVRGVEQRTAERSAGELWEVAQPMLRRILADAESRVASVLRIGEADGEGPGQLEPALAEQVDGYLVQVGDAVRIYGRLARATGHTETFFADIRPWLARSAEANLQGNRFEDAQRFAMQSVLFDLALEPKLGDPAADPDAGGGSPEAALAGGLKALRQALGDDAVDWDRLAAGVGAP